MTGRTVVWLHGFMGSGACGATLLDRTAREHDCRVVAPDLPGHGLSSGIRPESLQAVANHVLRTVQASEFDLVGYSLGGRVALHMARSAPDRVHRMVLESANPGLAAGADRARRLAADAATADRLARCTGTDAFRQFLRDWYHQDVFLQDGHPPADIGSRIAAAETGDPDALAQVLRACSLGGQDDFRSFITARKQPTMLLCGGLDRKYAEIYRGLQHASERIRVHEVHGAGHTVHRDAPDAYLDVLFRFLNQPVS